MEKYDVVIIGAGIGGLVCGCFLAKAGKRVLILEKNKYPGGYCTSFTRQGFVFDAGFHCLGSCGEDGYFRKIMRELHVDTTLSLKKLDPSNIVITPDFKLEIFSDINRTKNNFKEVFNTESPALDRFFSIFLLGKMTPSKYLELKQLSYNDFLSMHFKNKALISVLSVFLANIGIPPQKISAFTASYFLKEFIFGGGYYPKGGAASISTSFVNKFLSLGGSLKYNSKVDEIIIKNKKAIAVLTKNSNCIHADFFVSNCDSYQTFFNLLKNTNFLKKDKIKKFIPSVSAYAVFLGVDNNQHFTQKENSCYWLLKNYCINETLNNIFEENANLDESFIFLTSPSEKEDSSILNGGKKSIILMVNAPFKNSDFWNEQRGLYEERLIKTAKIFFNKFLEKIIIKTNATPQTFYNYTFNHKGAMTGWANTIDQARRNVMPAKTQIENLFLAGHWVTSEFGQGGVAASGYSGFLTSQVILKDKKN